jgi:hypothetical protein
LAGLGRKADLDVPLAVLLLDLGVKYCDKLLPSAKGFHVSVSLVPFGRFLKRYFGKGISGSEKLFKLGYGLFFLLVLGLIALYYPA